VYPRQTSRPLLSVSHTTAYVDTSGFSTWRHDTCWSTGAPIDSEDTLRFAELSGVRPMIETYPLEQAAEAYARMTSGDAQFRVVLTM
jgi:hypothetical protein